MNNILLPLLKMESSFLLPLLIAYSGLIKNYKRNINVFFIRLNNMIVHYGNKKIDPTKILILLPRCLQNSNCTNKLTDSITNCQSCNNCNIGSIKGIAEKYGVTSIVLVSGGTAARTIIPSIRPELIIAIACERELVTGISDVRKIPVIGLLNETPNGPCFNTVVDPSKLIQILSTIIDHKTMEEYPQNDGMIYERN